MPDRFAVRAITPPRGRLHQLRWRARIDSELPQGATGWSVVTSFTTNSNGQFSYKVPYPNVSTNYRIVLYDAQYIFGRINQGFGVVTGDSSCPGRSGRSANQQCTDGASRALVVAG
jgi:hypothetical protein